MGKCSNVSLFPFSNLLIFILFLLVLLMALDRLAPHLDGSD